MKIYFILFSLISIIFFGNTISLANELNTLKLTCCCEKNCSCEHEKQSKTIIRNIKCGDSASVVQTITSKNLISIIKVTFWQKSLSFAELNKTAIHIKINLKVIEPPPPKVS